MFNLVLFFGGFFSNGIYFHFLVTVFTSIISELTFHIEYCVSKCLLLFVALHSMVWPLSILFPVRVMWVVFIPALLVMSLEPRYQVMVGAGNASLLTTHWITFWMPSLIVSWFLLGIKEKL